MLKTDIVKEGKIIGARLITGEEVSFKVLGVSDSKLLITNPRSLAQDETGSYVIMDTIQTVSREDTASIELNRSNVVFFFDLEKNVHDNYEDYLKGDIKKPEDNKDDNSKKIIS